MLYKLTKLVGVSVIVCLLSLCLSGCENKQSGEDISSDDSSITDNQISYEDRFDNLFDDDEEEEEIEIILPPTIEEFADETFPYFPGSVTRFGESFREFANSFGNGAYWSIRRGSIVDYLVDSGFYYDENTLSEFEFAEPPMKDIIAPMKNNQIEGFVYSGTRDRLMRHFVPPLDFGDIPKPYITSSEVSGSQICVWRLDNAMLCIRPLFDVSPYVQGNSIDFRFFHNAFSTVGYFKPEQCNIVRRLYDEHINSGIYDEESIALMDSMKASDEEILNSLYAVFYAIQDAERNGRDSISVDTVHLEMMLNNSRRINTVYDNLSVPDWFEAPGYGLQVPYIDKSSSSKVIFYYEGPVLYWNPKTGKNELTWPEE